MLCLHSEKLTITYPIISVEEDFLDQQIDWMRSVSDGAPVERTFIQFSTSLKARVMKDGEYGDGWTLLDVIFAYFWMSVGIC